MKRAFLSGIVCMIVLAGCCPATPAPAVPVVEPTAPAEAAPTPIT